MTKNQKLPHFPFSHNQAKTFHEAILSLLFPALSECGTCAEPKALALAAKECTLSPLILKKLTKKVPALRNQLLLDAQAIIALDPAAQSLTEIILTYPGFYAITTHRVAHFLWCNDVRLLARALSELAHSRTGIDIHPGASIGNHFCIDHGTGIVIGETTIIGNHVTLYQGVTLGGTTVHRGLKTKKRHPTIKNHVTIYANATILGGTTIIGTHSIIGGNVWLTTSVPANSRVLFGKEITKINSSKKG